ncbi:unnamed protein product [Hyaloperonospora brassicae]|uniref:Uncharacterized protein n=1 Tax=Hyaloperonospora brassicae TaxID=162125 RepID=A0AAV0UKM6_HYABA|nr:unnamed protein product [Hyaloperonospora brassicae]
MEGFLIRVPLEACFPDTYPDGPQTSRADASRSVSSRALYYVLEEGYLRGYDTPNSVREPVESLQLTAHRIEVNVMYSLNIFEIKAQVVTVHPSQQPVNNSLRSDSIDDDDRCTTTTTATQVTSTALCASPTTSPSPQGVICGNYHTVFFAANGDLVKKWSLKLLNWNRHVFGPSTDHNEAELKQSNVELMQSLQVVNAANRFLRPIDVMTMPEESIVAEDMALTAATSLGSSQVRSTPAPVYVSTLASSPSKHPAAETGPGIDSSSDKPSDWTMQPLSSWWPTPFGRHRKVSSYSLRC